ncbi:MAG: DNA polymerase III subunit gamma/tau [Candidatus Margulisiibacteriota bacterium]|jgi:DNA polymerase-3 subunit gamma/tau
MDYISLYRRYRPQDFKDVSGQVHVVQTLQNAVANDRLAHAYIFSGPRGTGKTSMARILAKTLNCRKANKQNPCNECDLCIAITEGNSIDIMEIDAASNRGIDDIRQLRERVNFAPVEGPYKVYIIDEVHMLSNDAFNALLKTLEEPPKHVIFVLATTEPQKIPETILSRCQRLDFGRLSLEDIRARLKFIAKSEDIEVEDKVLTTIARDAEGGLRDAISLFDQIFSFAGKKIGMKDLITVIGTAETDSLFTLADNIISKDTTSALQLIANFIEEGKNIQQIVRDLLGHFRYLLFAAIKSESVIDLPEEHIDRLKEQAKRLPLGEIKAVIGVLSRVELQMRWHPDSRLLLEIAMVELTESTKNTGIQEYKDTRIQEEKKSGSNTKRTEPVEAAPSGRLKAEQVVDTKPENRSVLPAVHKVALVEVQAAPVAAPQQDAAVPTGSAPSLADIKHKWAMVLNNIKNKKMTTYMLICEGEPVALNDDILMIGFKQGYSWHKEKLKGEENERVVLSVLKDVFGQQFKVETTVDTGNTNQAQGAVGTDSMHKKALDLFGGKVVQQ